MAAGLTMKYVGMRPRPNIAASRHRNLIVKMRRFASVIPFSHFLVRRCLTQSLPIQGPGGLIPQQHLQQQFMSTSRPPVSYKTIRITGEDDAERLYHLIAAYVEQPSLAESVSEVILDNEHLSPYPPSPCDFAWLRAMDDEESKQNFLQKLHADKEEKKAANKASLLSYETQAVLRTYVQELGLGEGATATMLGSLDWKHQPQVLDEGFEEDYDDDGNERYLTSHRNYALTALTLLLSLCKNITTLRLGSLGLGLLQDFLLKTNYNLLPKPALQKLETVEVLAGHRVSDYEGVYGTVEFLEYFQYFHRLPAIHSITIDGVMEYQAARETFVPRTGNMRKIQIEHADVSSGMLCIIILIPKALEELRLSLGGLWNPDGGVPMMILRDLGKALLEHRKTLRVLDLDIDYALHNGRVSWMEEGKDDDESTIMDGLMDREDEDYGLEYLRLDRESSRDTIQYRETPDARKYGLTIGSLHDFTALTHLSIGMKALMGPRESDLRPPFHLVEQPPFRLIDALPPNLEYLCLYGYEKGSNKDLDDHVEELLKKKNERLPRLREIDGIDKVVLDLGSIYSEDDKEEDRWVRPKREFRWEEA
ncbi:hypothetical protein B0T10DRAFT_577479 [Thelonectria olida]|uniref:Uncharacterized protein n=1 Tax=Thelonectria olida TaxID=1576542 RepID=A0A9P8WHD0_9HYPO|nr:hypothetical protein B0T10DRAFT_577479 [Thelonectria olida]